MSSHEQVERALESRRSLINEAIDTRLPVTEPARLYEASRYLLEAGGKRLRPTILLLAAESIAGVDPMSEPYETFPAGDETVDVMAAAVSIEVIQSFTLIHDDIMDDDDLRRGVPAVHREFDLETAILAGDTLYAKAFEYMLETGAPPDRSVRALAALARTCTGICEGQALDVEFESHDRITVEEYMRMIEYKTAVLYASAAGIPAILLGADEAVYRALRSYGLEVGRAFQIRDDLLDLTTPSDTLGKRRGSDLVEGKRTIVTVHARDNGVDVDGLVGADPTEAEIDDAVAELAEAGSIAFARETARELVAEGRAHLDALPAGEPRDLLAGIADYLVEREY